MYFLKNIIESYDINKLKIIYDARVYDDILEENMIYINHGDEANVYKVSSNIGKNYAIKIYMEEYPLDLLLLKLNDTLLLQNLGYTVKVYYMAIYDKLCYIVMDLADTNLEDYLKDKGKDETYYELILTYINKLKQLNKYDIELRLDNIVINLNEPYKLYMIDPCLLGIDNEFPDNIDEYINDLLIIN